MIRAQLRANRWQTLFRGTYLTGTGASINGRLFAQTSVDIAAATVTAP